MIKHNANDVISVFKLSNDNTAIPKLCVEF